MIVHFSKNPLKQIYGILFWNKWSILFFSICATTAYVLHRYLDYDWVKLPVEPVAILGGALAIFLGFRNSNAYDRWWEARKIWGAIVNDSRSFTMELISYCRVQNPGDENEQKELDTWRKKMVYRHIAWLYALNRHLRKLPIEDEIAPYLDANELEEVTKKSNVPAQLIAMQGNELETASEKGWMDEFRRISITEMLTRFYDDQGKAERIKNTIFPYYYNYFTKVFLWLFNLCLPFALVSLTGWVAIPISIAISFVFSILEKAGNITDTPFENRAADTPMTTLCRGIEIDLREMINDENIPEPHPDTITKFGVKFKS